MDNESGSMISYLFVISRKLKVSLLNRQIESSLDLLYLPNLICTLSNDDLHVVIYLIS
jgi:hypothetical protein